MSVTSLCIDNFTAIRTYATAGKPIFFNRLCLDACNDAITTLTRNKDLLDEYLASVDTSSLERLHTSLTGESVDRSAIVEFFQLAGTIYYTNLFSLPNARDYLDQLQKITGDLSRLYVKCVRQVTSAQSVWDMAV